MRPRIPFMALAAVLAAAHAGCITSSERIYVTRLVSWNSTGYAPAFNLSDEKAAMLPGNIPRLLAEARSNGTASEELSDRDYQTLIAELGFEKARQGGGEPTILYHGEYFSYTFLVRG